MTYEYPGKDFKGHTLRLFGGQVRRGRHLVHDTMLQVQIAASRRMLKRPLKVAFWGEEGVDEGGVQKVRSKERQIPRSSHAACSSGSRRSPGGEEGFA